MTWLLHTCARSPARGRGHVMADALSDRAGAGLGYYGTTGRVLLFKTGLDDDGVQADQVRACVPGWNLHPEHTSSDTPTTFGMSGPQYCAGG